MASASRTLQTVSNTELYNRWAKVYDTDGNILQAIDDILVPELLEKTLNALDHSRTGLTITELGCGTGRNTIKLVSSATKIPISTINALDLSPRMLEIARRRYAENLANSLHGQAAGETPLVNFYEFDAFNPSQSSIIGAADFVLATLVLEHLPLEVFFSTICRLLKPASGGRVLITNMHGEMGRISKAGFVDEDGKWAGVKVQGVSYVYDIEEVVAAGNSKGFELVGNVQERGVDVSDVGDGLLLGPRGTKWIGTKVWFGLVMKLAKNEA